MKKLQNLAVDPVTCIDFLHKQGLWVTGGFIVGFDSDKDDIFDHQIEFIERTAIPWALLNFLHALPRTALYDRVEKEGRLRLTRGSSGDGTPPNFRTVMDPAILLRGFSKVVSSIYNGSNYYERAWRSLQKWEARPCQHPSKEPTPVQIVKILAKSVWYQGFRSSYRMAYWKYFTKLFTRYAFDRPKLWLGFTIMISGHHFIPYGNEVAQKVNRELRKIEAAPELVAANVSSEA
jgi:radical SAM superfamily enzyme YgiQ (UPF0313 family)